jgi:uncharacterized protein YneF (UPF0154 family)
MDKRILLMASFVTLIGLIIGVILGYFITLSLQTNNIQDLQNQVSDLQNQIAQKDSQIQALQQQLTELETILGPIRKGDWNLIKSFEGSSYLINSDYFYVSGTELRINWTWIRSDPEFGSFSIYLYQEGDEAYTEWFWDLQESGTTFAYGIVQSYYYLKVLGSNLNYWEITVEVWIPK